LKEEEIKADMTGGGMFEILNKGEDLYRFGKVIV
jgi:hypothetical protein